LPSGEKTRPKKAAACGSVWRTRPEPRSTTWSPCSRQPLSRTIRCRPPGAGTILTGKLPRSDVVPTVSSRSPVGRRAASGSEDTSGRSGAAPSSAQEKRKRAGESFMSELPTRTPCDRADQVRESGSKSARRPKSGVGRGIERSVIRWVIWCARRDSNAGPLAPEASSHSLPQNPWPAFNSRTFAALLFGSVETKVVSFGSFARPLRPTSLRYTCEESRHAHALDRPREPARREKL